MQLPRQLRHTWVVELCSEVFHRSPDLESCVDANACRGILLRTGTGRVQHLSSKQQWVQGAVRDANLGADLLAQCVSESSFNKCLLQVNFIRASFNG